MSSEKRVERFCHTARANSAGPLPTDAWPTYCGHAWLVGRAGADLEGHERLHVEQPEVLGVGLGPGVVDELRHRPGVGGAADAVDAGVEGAEAGLLLEVGGLVAHGARAAEHHELRGSLSASMRSAFTVRSEVVTVGKKCVPTDP